MVKGHQLFSKQLEGVASISVVSAGVSQEVHMNSVLCVHAQHGVMQSVQLYLCIRNFKQPEHAISTKASHNQDRNDVHVHRH